MSHFTVAVFSRTGNIAEIERMLAPYCENVDEHSPYAEFMPEGNIEGENTADLIEDGYKIIGNEFGYFGNPNAKWDWYSVGGRWFGAFKLKDGFCDEGKLGERSWANANEEIPSGRCDSAKVKHIDFTPNEEKYNRALRLWEVVVEHSPLKDGEKDFVSFWNEKYYTDTYGTKECYAEECSLEFLPFAAVTLDGEWHEEGSMGWFGCSTSTNESKNSFKDWFLKYIEEIDPEMYITMVDCHI